MTLRVGYMGTKRSIAPFIAKIASSAPGGPFLDLFCGICSVAEEVGESRAVWCNDVQYFAANVATAFLASDSFPPEVAFVADFAYPLYAENEAMLKERFSDKIEAEKEILLSGNVSKIKNFNESLPYIINSVELESERQILATNPFSYPYRLFTITFAAGYFGINQCIQVDSIRYAIDYLLKTDFITKEQHRWMILALCQAIANVSTTTGHFAQFLTINDRNRQRYIAQRKKCVWHEWINSFYDLYPIGTKRWRRGNRVFQKDARTLLCCLHSASEKPSLIYADPPYTDDQYSRYYHIYETLILYDYPSATGKGRYRPDRFRSFFSSKQNVSIAFEQMIDQSAKLGAHLIISYPENGLLSNAKDRIYLLLRKHFYKVDIAGIINHRHSSLGASKGLEKYPVIEIIFYAR